MRILDVNWDERRYLNATALTILYELTPMVVAKVGRIKPQEIVAQRYFAEQGKAVPVLDYQPNYLLPLAVQREHCLVHGLRGRQGFWCQCSQLRTDVLLMPKAGPIDKFDHSARALAQEIEEECERLFGFRWRYHAGNLALYDGRVVAGDLSSDALR